MSAAGQGVVPSSEVLLACCLVGLEPICSFYHKREGMSAARQGVVPSSEVLLAYCLVGLEKIFVAFITRGGDVGSMTRSGSIL